MNLNRKLTLHQKLSIKQLLSPKLIHMLNMFHQPYNELLQEAEMISNENVFIEVTQYDQLSDYAYQQTKQHHDASFMGKDVSDFAVDPSNKETLYNFVLAQLDLLHLSEKEDKIARFLIEHLDDRGYLPDFYEVRKQAVSTFNVKERKVSDVLKIVQTLEPDGVGARNLKECLLIQIENHDFQSKDLHLILKKVIQNHLDQLGDRSYEYIAKSLKIEPQGVEYIAKFIKQNLSPTPGSRFVNSTLNQHIVPSFEISIEGDKLHLINLEQKLGIKVNISDKYLRDLKDPTLDETTKLFLKEKYERAKEFIHNLERRHETLETLAQHLVSKQLSFIKRGEPYLEPLLQKDIAKELGISSSTVSRIVSSKFIRTPHGVFNFKHLCPRSHFGKTALRLKEIIKDYVNRYPAHSDDKISRLLKKEGIDIARRTVTKYRLLQGLDSSVARRLKDTENTSNPEGMSL